MIAVCRNSVVSTLPQLGKVVAIDESSVKVDWLVGSYSSIFTFWKEKGRKYFPFVESSVPLSYHRQ